MECPVCLEGYSSDASLLPKLTPCGHLVCAGCLRRVQQCPKCRKEFSGPVDALPTVFDAIGGRERADSPTGWWCTECDAAASAQCRDNHPIIRMQVALRRHAAKLASLASEAVQGLENAVQAAAEEPARLALQLLADGDAAAECELTVRRGGSVVGAQWRLEEGGAADGLDRALLCKLAATGRLRKLSTPADGTPEATVPLGPIIPEVNASQLSSRKPTDCCEEKEELLQRVSRQGVRRLENLYSKMDPTWSLRLLKASTASLEELELHQPRPEHLLVACSAPRLRRLLVWGDQDLSKVDGQPLVLPALSAPSSMQWLKVHNLPQATLESLLRAHAASLRTLVLYVGIPGSKDWPTCCQDLDVLLGGCGLAALRNLQLRRIVSEHRKPGCKQQIQALRRVLPATTVLCSDCDKDKDEEF